MRRAFTFDASACTGCKACQVACKDRHTLPPGMLWRRVYEVVGGSWERRGAAWVNTVFAYNMSVACNHCADPACAAACPTGACVVRDDGVVWIEGGKCAGCEYCAWACPYGAPQYAPESGRMTKCDFCRDLLDAGQPPACVSACPMRALGIAEVPGSLPPVAAGLWEVPSSAHPYPLPPTSRTRPQLAVTPHAAMYAAQPKAVANAEEVRPAHPGDPARHRPLDDLPLVLFTLLAQAAAGAAAIRLFATEAVAPFPVLIGGLTVAAALASLFHLGRASRAWRAPANARSSALSREVLALAVFALAWLIDWVGGPGGPFVLAAAGVALVYFMAEVYDLDAVPGWNRSRTLTAFAASALVLGAVAVLAATRFLPAWAIATLAAAVGVDQFLRRWRFYGLRHGRVM